MTVLVSTTGPFPAFALNQIAGSLAPDDLANITEAAARDDVATALIIDNENDRTVQAWVVYGPSDPPTEIILYGGRSEQGGMAKMVLRAMFGVSEVIGTPMRIHTEKFEAYRRMIGAAGVTKTVDEDGLPAGVYHHGE